MKLNSVSQTNSQLSNFFIHKAKAKTKDKVRSYSYQKVTVV